MPNDQQQARTSRQHPSSRLCVLWTALKAVAKGSWAFLFNSAVYRNHRWSTRRTFLFQCFKQWKNQVEAGTVTLPEPNTGEIIVKACASHQWPHTPRRVDGDGCPDAVLHEIRPHDWPTNGPLILYFHGGGYHNPIQPAAHLSSCHAYGVALGASAMFVLEYTLTPAAQYPVQLRQAVVALRYLLEERKFRPPQITMGGDSAGGNLALALLAHILQPHPDIPPMPPQFFNGDDSARFKGVFLISPWVTPRTDAASYRENQSADFLTIARTEDFVELWQPVESDLWASPLLPDAGFWARLPVERIILTVGSLECLRDPVVGMWRKMQSAESNGTEVEFVLAEGEIHVHLAFDFVFRTSPCESRRRLVQWFEGMKE